MRARTRIIAPLALAVALTAACGESGSSGTGGDADASGTAAGDTCAPVAGDQLVVLEDDKQLQNAENLVPVVNSDWLKDNPKAEDALNQLSEALTTEDLTAMNQEVDAERQEASQVAEDFLKDKGLI